MVVGSFVFPIFCYLIAKMKNKNPYIAFLLGFLILPVIYYALIPAKNRLRITPTDRESSDLVSCSNCNEIYHKAVRNCPSCASDSRTVLNMGKLKGIIESELKGDINKDVSDK